MTKSGTDVVDQRAKLNLRVSRTGDGGKFRVHYSWHDIDTKAVIKLAATGMPEGLHIGNNAGNGVLLISRFRVPADRIDMLNYPEYTQAYDCLYSTITEIAQEVDERKRQKQDAEASSQTI